MNTVLYAKEWSNFKVKSWETITDNTGIKLTDLFKSPTFENILKVIIIFKSDSPLQHPKIVDLFYFKCKY